MDVTAQTQRFEQCLRNAIDGFRICCGRRQFAFAFVVNAPREIS